MNHRMFLLSLVLFLCSLQNSVAYGAKVLAVNKAKDKIIIKLSRKELAAVNLGQGYFLNVTSKDLTIHGTISKINPLKSTTVLTLETPQDGLAKNQTIVFLHTSWSASHSPSFAIPIQYKHKPKNEIELELIIQESSLKQTVEISDANNSEENLKRKIKIDESSSKFSGIVNLELIPKAIGASTAFSMHEGTKTTTQDGSSLTTITSVTIFNPDIWYQVEEFWTIGAGLIHTFYSKDFRTNETSSVHSTESDQFSLSLLRDLENAFLGFEYTHRSIRTLAADIKNTVTGEVVPVTYTIKRPSMLKSFFKSNPDSRTSWTLGVGYTFWERDRGDDQLARAASYPEMMQLNFLYEFRLDSGNKVDTNVYLHGSKTENHLLDSKEINVLGFEFKYRAPLNYDWAWSATLGTEGGLATSNSSDIHDKTTTDGYSIMIGGAISRSF